ncbi:MAG: alpha/beta hydrolase [Myxococcota bacterium]
MTKQHNTIVLETAASAFANATATSPFLFEIPVAEGRKAVDGVQTNTGITKLPVEEEWVEVDANAYGVVRVRIVRPAGLDGQLPVIVYVHGAGWVFGNAHTHDRLVRELATGAQAAVVFPDYDRSPEARYPIALEQSYATAAWAASGAHPWLDPTHLVVAGDSVGGNMTAALTILAKQRGGPQFDAQVLFYPVTDANFDTSSYQQFAEGYFLRRDAMQWFWDQYTLDPVERAQITASPLRATSEDLSGLPPALVITAEADVLRDEGEAYAAKLRDAGVPVTAVRYLGAIHDFVMLDALRNTHAADSAIKLAISTIRDALH